MLMISTFVEFLLRRKGKNQFVDIGLFEQMTRPRRYERVNGKPDDKVDRESGVKGSEHGLLLLLALDTTDVRSCVRAWCVRTYERTSCV